MNLVQTRQVGRGSSQQGVQAARGAGDAQNSANQPQYDALTENLATEFARRGAESGADAPFTAPVGHAADPQPAEVDANDEQNRARTTKQQPKLLTHSLHGEILNRDQVGVQGKLRRSGARKIRLNDVELRERLRPR